MIETLWAFVQFSLVIALFSSIAKVVITAFRLSKVDEEEFTEFKQFNNARLLFVSKKNSTFKIVLSRLMYFIPGHAIMMNTFFIYHVLTNEGTYGIIKGIIAAERISFVPLIKFAYKDDV